jgi:hypothetical protein
VTQSHFRARQGGEAWPMGRPLFTTVPRAEGCARPEARWRLHPGC